MGLHLLVCFLFLFSLLVKKQVRLLSGDLDMRLFFFLSNPQNLDVGQGVTQTSQMFGKNNCFSKRCTAQTRRIGLGSLAALMESIFHCEGQGPAP